MRDDDADDDASGPNVPLPPEDRLWRHPSEIGAGAPFGGPAGAPPVPARDAGPFRPMWAVAVVAGLSGAVVAVAALAVTGSLSPRLVERNGSSAAVQLRSVPTSTAPKTVRDVAAVVGPAVVRVELDEGDRAGSGVVVAADGVLVTSAALVGDAERVVVVHGEGEESVGTVLGVDEVVGVAVVRVAGEDLPVAPRAKRSPVTGQTAITVSSGSGRSAGVTVTAGVVSAIGGDATGPTGLVRGLIQTDRPMPADADGGALADGDGDVVGMCMLLESEDGIGMAGYAVPIAVATAVADDLVAHGRVRHAWLGIEGDDLDAEDAAELGVDGGAVVQRVTSGGPADSSGLSSGDVVVAVDGMAVDSMDDLVAAVSARRPGQQIILAYRRDGADAMAVVVLTEKPR